MNITDCFTSKDLSLEKKQEPSDDRFKMFNDGGVECEVGEFLYGLVRMIKPLHVLETGTHLGISASYIAQALKDNDIAGTDLVTLEINEDFIERAKRRWKVLRLGSYIYCYKDRSLQYSPEVSFDLIFLDSEPDLRWDEVGRFLPRLKGGGFLFIHDLHRHLCEHVKNPDHPNFPYWPFGPPPENIKWLVTKGLIRPVHFPTPRGLTGFYKVHPEDYKW